MNAPAVKKVYARGLASDRITPTMLGFFNKAAASLLVQGESVRNSGRKARNDLIFSEQRLFNRTHESISSGTSSFVDGRSDSQQSGCGSHTPARKMNEKKRRRIGFGGQQTNQPTTLSRNFRSIQMDSNHPRERNRKAKSTTSSEATSASVPQRSIMSSQEDEEHHSSWRTSEHSDYSVQLKKARAFVKSSIPPVANSPTNSHTHRRKFQVFAKKHHPETRYIPTSPAIEKEECICGTGKVLIDPRPDHTFVPEQKKGKLGTRAIRSGYNLPQEGNRSNTSPECAKEEERWCRATDRPGSMLWNAAAAKRSAEKISRPSYVGLETYFNSNESLQANGWRMELEKSTLHRQPSMGLEDTHGARNSSERPTSALATLWRQGSAVEGGKQPKVGKVRRYYRQETERDDVKDDAPVRIQQESPSGSSSPLGRLIQACEIGTFPVLDQEILPGLAKGSTHVVEMEDDVLDADSIFLPDRCPTPRSLCGSSVEQERRFLYEDLVPGERLATERMASSGQLSTFPHQNRMPDEIDACQFAPYFREHPGFLIPLETPHEKLLDLRGLIAGYDEIVNYMDPIFDPACRP
ncbi:hypothetical protein IE53DRAFT_181861 [Violaceomyces palustris]|uniref:Uncharacterized protein n=1 Tax=Violaceomyces palustris TaxID=1673888 RepID=A0ACD0P5I3_9BASI|nr:hypothetical protein IE53DRAFT_181861 [Violaceomyces palustris]